MTMFFWFQGRPGDSLDDRHVMTKHQAIYPNEDELSIIQKLVINTEKALKGISDDFAEKDTTAANGGCVLSVLSSYISDFRSLP